MDLAKLYVETLTQAEAGPEEARFQRLSKWVDPWILFNLWSNCQNPQQGCISCGTCSYLELTEDHVLTSAYVKIFRIVTRNAVNKSFWRKKDCSWPPLNKYAMNIWLSSLRIRAHLSWRTGKHLHVLHVLRTYSTCSYPGYQDTTTYAALLLINLCFCLILLWKDMICFFWGKLFLLLKGDVSPQMTCCSLFVESPGSIKLRHQKYWGKFHMQGT